MKKKILIEKYAKDNKLSVNDFIRNLVLDKIDEKRILSSLRNSKLEEISNHTDVWRRLGI